MITHKILPVSDTLCQSCGQCYQGECRVFTVPHSPHERKHREADQFGLCRHLRHREIYKEGGD